MCYIYAAFDFCPPSTGSSIIARQAPLCAGPLTRCCLGTAIDHTPPPPVFLRSTRA